MNNLILKEKEGVVLEKYETLSDEILADLVELNSQVFADMYANDPYSLDQYIERLKEKELVIYKLKDKASLVANSVAYKEENSLYLWILAVKKEFRNLGYATNLLENNEKYAKNRDLEKIRVKVYNVSKPMQNLLEKRSYLKLETIKSELNKKYNAIIFELKI
jgi:ribosomal protein S18 acetylase RimI-like enzyme